MKGIQRDLNRAAKKALLDIHGNAHGFFGAGLSTEGYAGGYHQALMDVQLAMRGVNPNSRYWNSRPILGEEKAGAEDE